MMIIYSPIQEKIYFHFMILYCTGARPGAAVGAGREPACGREAKARWRATMAGEKNPGPAMVVERAVVMDVKRGATDTDGYGSSGTRGEAGPGLPARAIWVGPPARPTGRSAARRRSEGPRSRGRGRPVSGGESVSVKLPIFLPSTSRNQNPYK